MDQAIPVIWSVKAFDREQSQIGFIIPEKAYFLLCMSNISWVTMQYKYHVQNIATCTEV